jgi:DDE superfamily endonuclease
MEQVVLRHEGGGVAMTQRIACPPAPGPLEAYAEHFDALFDTLAQRRSFREYLQGLLLPRERNKTLTALAGVEPIVGAQAPAVQRLQFFLSESAWDAEAVNAQRLAVLCADPATSPHAGGVLVIDETGDRKDGTKTAHVARQYLGSIGKIDNGIVAVSSLWADEGLYYPLHIHPYTPAKRLPEGKKDPAFRTKPQIAVDLVARARAADMHFRAVVADCWYGDSPTFVEALWAAKVPFVVGLKPTKGVWAREGEAHTPEEAARRLRWGGEEAPGDWTKVVRRFRDGHEETWWAADLTFAGYGPDNPIRLVVATTDPATLPALSTWYLATILPRPGSPQAATTPLPPADLAEVVRIYGLRQWVEQSYKQVKHELGWADFQVRTDQAIRRHWQMVCCAFSFCWWAWFHQHDTGTSVLQHVAAEVPAAISVTAPPVPAATPEDAAGGKRSRTPSSVVLACGAAPGARLARPVGYAVALLARMVECAPTTGTTGPPRRRAARTASQPLSPTLTKYL